MEQVFILFLQDKSNNKYFVSMKNSVVDAVIAAQEHAYNTNSGLICRQDIDSLQKDNRTKHRNENYLIEKFETR